MAGDCTQADTDSPSPTTRVPVDGWCSGLPVSPPSSSHVLGSPAPPYKGLGLPSCLRMAVFHPQVEEGDLVSNGWGLEPGHLAFKLLIEVRSTILAIFKCVYPWRSAHSPAVLLSPESGSRMFCHLGRRPEVSVTTCAPLPLAAAPSNHKSAFCLCYLVIKTEPCNT